MRNSPYRYALGHEMRRLRRARGKIVADQARALGIRPSVISSIEAGDQPLPPNYLSDFAEWLSLAEKDLCHLRELHSHSVPLSITSNISSIRSAIPQEIKSIRLLKITREK